MAEEENRAVESGSNFSAVRELLRQAESLLTGADHNIPSTVSIASGGRERAPARPTVNFQGGCCYFPRECMESPSIGGPNRVLLLP